MSRRAKKRRMPVRFLPTLAGWLFLGVAVLLGVAAVKSQVALMFVAFGGMIGALHVSAMMAKRMVGAVQVTRDLPERAWQFQTVPLGYHLRNTRRRSSLSLAVREADAEGIDSVAGFCAHLPGGSVFRTAGRFFARRRGRINLPELRVSTTFPFGLVVATKRIPAKASVVIWPARGRLKGQLLHRGAVESSAAAPSLATGGQDEFFGLREYRPGDNPRWIHWRRSANKATPVVREMTRPLPESLWVILDVRLAEADDEDARSRRERRIRFAATLIDYAFSRGYQVGLALAYAGGVAAHRPAAGRGQRQLLLDRLADVDDSARAPLGRVLRGLGRGQLGLSQVVLAAGDAEELDRSAVAGLRAACRHLTIVTDGQLPQVFEDASLGGADGRPDGRTTSPRVSEDASPGGTDRRPDARTASRPEKP